PCSWAGSAREYLIPPPVRWPESARFGATCVVVRYIARYVSRYSYRSIGGLQNETQRLGLRRVHQRRIRADVSRTASFLSRAEGTRLGSLVRARRDAARDPAVDSREADARLRDHQGARGALPWVLYAVGRQRLSDAADARGPGLRADRRRGREEG